MTSLAIRNLTKTFGEGKVVDDVSIDVGEGEFIVLVGPSGCGKSTTLRMIAGLEGIDGGSLMLDGRDITDQPSSKRDLAMVFQSSQIHCEAPIEKTLDDLIVPTYSQDTFENLQARGFRLITKHAKSLGL